MTQNILLDPAIRDWVLFPLIVLMIFVGILRHYVTLLLKSTPKVKLTTANDAKPVSYARLLLVNGRYLSPSGYKQRSERFCGQGSGLLRKKVEHNPMEAMSDPSMMGDMMKNNMTMMIPNIGMMTVVSYFFSGFVIAKFPFSLSARTRGLTQRGVDIDNLECSYVTSLSMYFLILFGLQGILKLLLGDNEGDETKMQMQMMQQPANQPVDYSKVFKQLLEEMEFEADRYKWSLDDATKRLLLKSPQAGL